MTHNHILLTQLILTLLPLKHHLVYQISPVALRYPATICQQSKWQVYTLANDFEWV